MRALCCGLGIILLLLGSAAQAQTYRIIIEGPGPAPQITTTTSPGGTPTPPIVPPVTPPVTPPGPEVPFVWPPQPPIGQNDPSARYTSIGYDPAWRTMGDFYTYYTALAEYQNPLPGSHAFACFVPNGQRLWAPRNGTPSVIRTACATGALPKP